MAWSASYTPWWLTPKFALPISVLIWCGLGLVGAVLPLVADEAYYLAWSHRLALGYFDHPPMIAYSIAALGHMPRLTAWLICGLSIGILTLSAKNLQLRYWYACPALFLCTPLGVVAAIIATPDTPLLLASSIVIYGMVTQRKRYLFIGLCLGLWSKPTAIFLLPAIWWGQPKRWAVLISLGALVTYLPHIYWSINHAGLPWTFQSGRVYELMPSSPLQIMEMLATQCLLVGPLLVMGAYRCCRLPKTDLERLCLSLALPTLLFAIVLAFGMRVEGNWPMLMWPPIILLSLKMLEQNLGSGAIRLHSIFMGLTLCVAILICLAHKYIPRHVGPDRDGPQLTRCLTATFPNRRVLPTRYQEASLMMLTMPAVSVLSNVALRESQFTLWNDQIVNEAPCGGLVIGFGAACPQSTQLHTACGVKVFECTCP